MKRIILFGALICSLLSFVSSSAQAEDWTFYKEVKGVKVWEKKTPGSSVFVFKGIKTMKLPIGKIVAAIESEDTEQKKRWIDMLIEIKLLEREQPGNVQYHVYDFPWPVSDRDLVLKYQKSFDPSGPVVMMSLKSVEHKLAPEAETVGVRGSADLVYTLKMIDQNTTEVTAEATADPKGSVPKWIVNLINRGWPSNTLAALEEEVIKSNIKEDKETGEHIQKFLNLAH